MTAFVRSLVRFRSSDFVRSISFVRSILFDRFCSIDFVRSISKFDRFRSLRAAMCYCRIFRAVSSIEGCIVCGNWYICNERYYVHFCELLILAYWLDGSLG